MRLAWPASSVQVSRSRAMPVGGPHRENWPALQAVPALLRRGRRSYARTTRKNPGAGWPRGSRLISDQTVFRRRRSLLRRRTCRKFAQSLVPPGSKSLAVLRQRGATTHHAISPWASQVARNGHRLCEVDCSRRCHRRSRYVKGFPGPLRVADRRRRHHRCTSASDALPERWLRRCRPSGSCPRCHPDGFRCLSVAVLVNTSSVSVVVRHRSR